jgi:transcriptional regulator with XRE-family HTH domain
MIREAITTALKNQGVSQRRCAIDCDITPQTFNNFLKGHRPMPLDKLERVIEYLKIKMK